MNSYWDILSMFKYQDVISTLDIGQAFDYESRYIRKCLRKLVERGFIEETNKKPFMEEDSKRKYYRKLELEVEIE